MSSNLLPRFVKIYSKILKITFSKLKLRTLVICMIAVGLFSKRGITPTSIIYSLTPDQVYFNSTPEQVLRVLRDVRFTLLANFEMPLVEVRSLKTLWLHNPNFTFDAPMHILCKVLNRTDYLKVLKLANTSISSLKCKSNLKIRNFKETLFDPILYSLVLSKQSIKLDLVTTQSSMFKLPEVFKYTPGQKKIMAWYSTNVQPIFASDDVRREGVNFSAFKDFIDEHWVWNQEDVAFFQSKGIERVIPVGPIIFQDKLIEEKELNRFTITYFDVTPLQENTGFYSEKNTTLVLNNILKLGEMISQKYPNRLVLCIKPKRQYFKYHSEGYISIVKRATQLQQVRFLSPTSNLYATITKSDLVLAIPFTSPALIAKELNVKQIFVSTGIEGWDLPESFDGVDVVSQFAVLLESVETEIINKFNL